MSVSQSGRHAFSCGPVHMTREPSPADVSMDCQGLMLAGDDRASDKTPEKPPRTMLVYISQVSLHTPTSDGRWRHPLPLARISLPCHQAALLGIEISSDRMAGGSSEEGRASRSNVAPCHFLLCRAARMDLSPWMRCLPGWLGWIHKSLS